MDTYKIHFRNPENSYTVLKEFTKKDLLFDPENPNIVLEVENTYFLLKSHSNSEYFYEKVKGEQASISQEEIDTEWYMVLDWAHIKLTKDPYDE